MPQQGPRRWRGLCAAPRHAPSMEGFVIHPKIDKKRLKIDRFSYNPHNPIADSAPASDSVRFLTPRYCPGYGTRRPPHGYHPSAPPGYPHRIFPPDILPVSPRYPPRYSPVTSRYASNLGWGPRYPLSIPLVPSGIYAEGHFLPGAKLRGNRNSAKLGPG